MAMHTSRPVAQAYKHLPNCITLLRIVGTAALLFIEPLSIAFYVIYTLAGISDIVDGWVARRLNITSDAGAKLDSVADLLFYTVMGVRIFPTLWDRLPGWIWIGVGAVIAIRLLSYAVAACKYRRFAAMHTYMNKLTGAAVFAIPYAIQTPQAVPLCTFFWAISVLASIEELAIHLLQKEYDAGTKTILRLLPPMKRAAR